MTLSRALLLAPFAVLAMTGAARADEPSAPAADAPPAAPAVAAPVEADAQPTPAEKKGAYALPFALRPAIASNIVRVDLPIAEQKSATTLAPTLTAGFKPFDGLPDLGLYVRAALVDNSPDVGPSGTIVSNPLFFGLYSPEIAAHVRLPIFFGITAPVGGGGGDTPAAGSRNAALSGIYARQAMDNALFATNYMTPTAGVGVAWIDHGFTVQLDTQLLYLIRTRGSAVDPDSSRVNFTSGLMVGYRIIPLLTADVEAHYQRWLSTPHLVDVDPTKRDQGTFGVGLRANVPLSKTMLARPGIAYFRGIDQPMTASALNYNIIQIDVPIAF